VRWSLFTRGRPLIDDSDLLTTSDERLAKRRMRASFGRIHGSVVIRVIRMAM
jgi:hypothetical protein